MVRKAPVGKSWKLRPDSPGLEKLDDLLELSTASSQVESSRPSMAHLPIDCLRPRSEVAESEESWPW